MSRFCLKNHLKNFFIIGDRKWNLTHHKSLHKKAASKIPEKESELQSNPSSLTIPYLMNSCGLSSESAIAAAKKINIKTTENPDRLIETLKSYGFKDTHITKLITKRPNLLLCKVDDIIRPKFDYYNMALGCTNLGDFVCGNPELLRAGLDNRVKPNFELLKSLFGTGQHVAAMVRRHSQLLMENLQTNFLPNVRTLQSYGVCKTNIAKLIGFSPLPMLKTNENLQMVVRSVTGLGLDPSSGMFVRGVYVMSVVTPSSWEKRVAVYKSFGWSKEEVMLAFSKQPNCMLMPVEKIRRSLEFFADTMEWEPSFISHCPVIMTYSLDERVIPRFLVMSVLVSKGLVTSEALRQINFLMINGKRFEDEYMAKYVDQVPQVFEIFKGRVEL